MPFIGDTGQLSNIYEKNYETATLRIVEGDTAFQAYNPADSHYKLITNLQEISEIGAVTDRTIQFTNVTTSFTTTSNAGISNTNPVHTLDIGSNVQIDDVGSNTFWTSGTVYATNYVGETATVTNSVTTRDVLIDRVFPKTNGFVQMTSNVGILNTAPIHTLDIGANVQIDEYGSNTFWTSGNVYSEHFKSSNVTVSGTVDTDKITVNDINSKDTDFVNFTSNVGILNTAPIHTLDIGANVQIDEYGSNTFWTSGNVYSEHFKSSNITVSGTIDTDEVIINHVNAKSTDFVNFTSNVGVLNTAPIHTLDIGANVQIDEYGSNTFWTSGNVHANLYTGSEIQLSGVIRATDFILTGGSEATPTPDLQTISEVLASGGGVPFSSDRTLTLSNVTTALDASVIQSITTKSNVIGNNVTAVTVNSNLIGNNVTAVTVNSNLIGNNVTAVTVNSNLIGNNVTAVTVNSNLIGNNVTAVTVNSNLIGNNVTAVTVNSNLIGNNVTAVTVNSNLIGNNVTAVTVNSNLIGNNVTAVTVNSNLIGNNVTAVTVNSNLIGNNVTAVTVNSNLIGNNVTAVTVNSNLIGNNVSASFISGNGDLIFRKYTIAGAGSGEYSVIGPGFDTATANPTLTLMRGQKYVFDNTAHHSFHPLEIREGNGGIAYASGVEDAGTATITFTVPMNAPIKLYYQCTQHSNMGNIIYIPLENLDTSQTLNLSNDLVVGTDKLVVDVSESRVGINNASPSKDLDVTGEIACSSHLTVGGNLTVNGTTTTVNTTSLRVEDTLIELGKNNTAGTSDLGLILKRPTGVGLKSNVAIVYSESVDTLKFGHTLSGSDATPVVFDTSNALAMSLNGSFVATGNVGIGTDSPGYALDVHGTSNVGALTATSLSGDGSGLTSLDAGNISSGTIDKDRLPTTLNNTTIGSLAVGTNDVTLTAKADYHGLKIIKAIDSPNEPATLLLAGDGDPGDDIAFEIRGNGTGADVDTTTTRDSDDTTFGILHTGHTYIGYPNLNPGETGGNAQNGDPMLNVSGDIYATGNVGIGTASPGYKLDVHGTSNVGALTATSLSGDGSGLSALNASNVSSGTLTRPISSTTGTFSGDVEVTGELTTKSNVFLGVMEGFAREGTLEFGRADGTDRVHNIKVYNSSTQTDNYMKFQIHAGGASAGTVTDNVLYLRGDGNVGIGTTNPGYKLDVDGHINLSTGSTLKINGTDAVFSNWTANGSDIYRSSGNVGIGATSPEQKLHIEDSANPGILIENTDGTLSLNQDIGSVIFKQNDNSSTGTGIIGKIRMSSVPASDGGNFYGEAANMIFSVGKFADDNANIDAVTIKNDGNVGIGTTSPATYLHLSAKNSDPGSTEGDLVGTHTLTEYLRFTSRGDGGDVNGVTVGFKLGGDDNSSVNPDGRLDICANDGASAGNEYGLTPDRTIATFLGSGNVGIGTTSPGYKLHVNGSSMFTSTINLTTSSGYATFEMGGPDGAYIDLKKPASDDYDLRLITTGTGGSIQVGGVGDVMNFDGSGNVGIGLTGITEKLHVSGNILATGDVTAYSDKRVKTDISKIKDPLNKVCSINGYTYKRTDTDDDKTHTGVLAQEVMEVLPEVVHGSEDTTYSVAYGNMVGLLIEAIKELKLEIDELKKSR